jgi:hypothetical protein
MIYVDRSRRAICYRNSTVHGHLCVSDTDATELNGLRFRLRHAGRVLDVCGIETLLLPSRLFDSAIANGARACSPTQLRDVLAERVLLAQNNRLSDEIDRLAGDDDTIRAELLARAEELMANPQPGD